MQAPSSIPKLFLSLNGSNEIPSVFLCCGMDLNGIPSIFIFRGMVRSEIVKFRLIFSSAKWFGRNSELFYLKKMVRNGIPSFFVFRGMARNGIPSIFHFAEQTEF
jgi:hypothetical protein